MLRQRSGSDMAMSPRELRRKIMALKAKPPITIAFERALVRQGTRSEEGEGYDSQKDHWLGWLSEYDGPGFYGRKAKRGRSAEFAYNHIVCPPMVLWLAEAAGVPRSIVMKAKRIALAAPPSLPSQSAAIRSVVPWAMIETQLSKRKSPGMGLSIPRRAST
jgi:hypothetical protein